MIVNKFIGERWKEFTEENGHFAVTGEYLSVNPAYKKDILGVSLAEVMVGLLMVSTIRFPSFKKPAGSPRAAMVTSLSIVLIFALMILLQQRFFVGFFATYVASSLLLNLAWKAGWRGIEPPHDGVEEPELIQ